MFREGIDRLAVVVPVTHPTGSVVSGNGLTGSLLVIRLSPTPLVPLLARLWLPSFIGERVDLSYTGTTGVAHL